MFSCIMTTCGFRHLTFSFRCSLNMLVLDPKADWTFDTCKGRRKRTALLLVMSCPLVKQCCASTAPDPPSGCGQYRTLKIDFSLLI